MYTYLIFFFFAQDCFRFYIQVMHCSFKIYLVHICGIRKFNADIDVEKTIQAPSFPEGYGDSMDCWYTITAPENTRIRFWLDNFGTRRFYSFYFYLWVSEFCNSAQ